MQKTQRFAWNPIVKVDSLKCCLSSLLFKSYHGCRTQGWSLLFTLCRWHVSITLTNKHLKYFENWILIWLIFLATLCISSCTCRKHGTGKGFGDLYHLVWASGWRAGEEGWRLAPHLTSSLGEPPSDGDVCYVPCTHSSLWKKDPTPSTLSWGFPCLSLSWASY